jgi:hypothetical protein
VSETDYLMSTEIKGMEWTVKKKLWFIWNYNHNLIPLRTEKKHLSVYRDFGS